MLLQCTMMSYISGIQCDHMHPQVVDRRVDFEATWQGKKEAILGLEGFSEKTTFYKEIHIS